MRKGLYHLSPGDKSWELAANFVRLFRSLDALMGGDEAATRSWLRTYNTSLHGVPAELIESVTGLVNAVAFVDAFRAKV
jgi:hypothetical protein